MNQVIESLNSEFVQVNVNYGIAPEYYDTNLVTFYQSNILVACNYFDCLDQGRSVVKNIPWSKILTDKFATCDANDIGMICQDLDRSNYVKDCYFDLAKCIYQNRHSVSGDVRDIENWLNIKSRYRLKPFAMSNLVGVYLEFLNKNKENFLIAFKNLTSTDWTKL